MAARNKRCPTLLVRADHALQFIRILGVAPLLLLYIRFNEHRLVVAVAAQCAPLAELDARLAYHPAAHVALHVEADARAALFALVSHGVPLTNTDAAPEQHWVAVCIYALMALLQLCVWPG
jgi:hypothetical protein